MGFRMIGWAELLAVPVLLMALAGSVFWLWMLVECLTKEDKHNKLVWAIVIVLTSLLGSILYFLIRRPQRKVELGD